MEYRKWPGINEKVSLLGTGTMRLPLSESGEIDEESAIAMIRRSIDGGVNYVDTAWMYHNGQSEVVVGKALADGYRQKVFLADKMPVWYAKTQEDMEKLFQAQLERCSTTHFDMYLLHNVNEDIWARAEKLDALSFLKAKKAQGKIRYLGFSFHGSPQLFPKIIDAHKWDFCQIQLNYMDTHFQAGVEGLHYASEKGLPLVIMEPLKGGKLTDRIPHQITLLWDKAQTKRTPADWALRWVANFPQVCTILSGMSTPRQVEDNMAILSNCQAGSLTAEELSIINDVAESYKKLVKYPCTDCKYCLPCPQKINIPKVMEFYNDWFLYDGNPKLRDAYYDWLPANRRASDCVACGLCENRCPQSIMIREAMERAAAIFK